jgi:hypothetical protein
MELQYSTDLEDLSESESMSISYNHVTLANVSPEILEAKRLFEEFKITITEAFQNDHYDRLYDKINSKKYASVFDTMDSAFDVDAYIILICMMFAEKDLLLKCRSLLARIMNKPDNTIDGNCKLLKTFKNEILNSQIYIFCKQNPILDIESRDTNEKDFDMKVHDMFESDSRKRCEYLMEALLLLQCTKKEISEGTDLDFYKTAFNKNISFLKEFQLIFFNPGVYKYYPIHDNIMAAFLDASINQGTWLHCPITREKICSAPKFRNFCIFKEFKAKYLWQNKTVEAQNLSMQTLFSLTEAGISDLDDFLRPIIVEAFSSCDLYRLNKILEWSPRAYELFVIYSETKDFIEKAEMIAQIMWDRNTVQSIRDDALYKYDCIASFMRTNLNTLKLFCPNRRMPNEKEIYKNVDFHTFTCLKAFIDEPKNFHKLNRVFDVFENVNREALQIYLSMIPDVDRKIFEIYYSIICPKMKCESLFANVISYVPNVVTYLNNEANFQFLKKVFENTHRLYLSVSTLPILNEIVCRIPRYLVLLHEEASSKKLDNDILLEIAKEDFFKNIDIYIVFFPKVYLLLNLGRADHAIAMNIISYGVQYYIRICENRHLEGLVKRVQKILESNRYDDLILEKIKGLRSKDLAYYVKIVPRARLLAESFNFDLEGGFD